MTPSPRRSGQNRPAGRQAGQSNEERAAAALTGGGPSILGVNGSMRARDVSRPRDDHYAEAERLVQVSYRPRSQPRPGPQPGSGGNSPDAS